MLYILFIYFIPIFILLTRRKATETLIHWISNYPELLPNTPRYCCPFEIKILLKLRIACQDYKKGESAVKCLFQGHNRIARVSFEPRSCQSQHGSLPLDHAVRFAHAKYDEINKYCCPRFLKSSYLTLWVFKRSKTN